MSHSEVYTLDYIKLKLLPVFEKYQVKRAAIFGSYAKNMANEYSDIDLLIYIDETFDLNKYLRFENAVKRVLKKKVDIVEFRCINRVMKEDILKEAIEIYGHAG